VVAADGDTVVGTLQLSFIPGIARRGAGAARSKPCASPPRTAAPAGQRLFEWAMDACRARGCQLLQLTTDKGRPDAHRFYEKLGFVASRMKATSWRCDAFQAATTTTSGNRLPAFPGILQMGVHAGPVLRLLKRVRAGQQKMGDGAQRGRVGVDGYVGAGQGTFGGLVLQIAVQR
jgi:hypothetical protein